MFVRGRVRESASQPTAVKLDLLGISGYRLPAVLSGRRVRSPCVAFHSPLFNQDLRLLRRGEDLSIQALVGQLSVQARTMSVLTRTSGFDAQRPCSQIRQNLRSSFVTNSVRRSGSREMKTGSQLCAKCSTKHPANFQSRGRQQFEGCANFSGSFIEFP